MKFGSLLKHIAIFRTSIKIYTEDGKVRPYNCKAPSMKEYADFIVDKIVAEESCIGIYLVTDKTEDAVSTVNNMEYDAAKYPEINARDVKGLMQGGFLILDDVPDFYMKARFGRLILFQDINQRKFEFENRDKW
ncbi:MAG: hypothetical protein K6B67_02500 [Lachnospiraceae bacterium]|nr:hypothetical protein [Lachnospiraceae bacterium]